MGKSSFPEDNTAFVTSTIDEDGISKRAVSEGEKINRNATKKTSILEDFERTSGVDDALKMLVKSILREDPAVHTGLLELSKKRSEDEEKLYRDILDLVKRES